jgi:universal stress protein E
MRLIEKILVGTDFSASAQSALTQAIDTAKKFGSHISLVHVIPEFEMTSLSEEMVRSAVQKEMHSLEEVVIDAGIPVESIIEKGVPFIEIMKIAELRDVNVIMVGSGDDITNVPGMTAEKLMSKSIKPVWISRMGATDEFKKILCAVDFSETSDRALQNAIHLARQLDRELVVLNVYEQPSQFYLKMKLDFSDKTESQKEEHRKQFEAYLERFDFSKIHWKQVFSDGIASENILNQIKSEGADLLVMGSVGHTAHPKMLTGSTAREVFRNLTCAVITFKSENIIQLKLDEEMDDIQSLFQQGINLLENGFVKEAISHFKYCLNEDPLFAPAWELLADAYFRLGEKQTAMEYKSKASEIRDRLWTQKVESDIKNRHTLYSSKNKGNK